MAAEDAEKKQSSKKEGDAGKDDKKVDGKKEMSPLVKKLIIVGVVAVILVIETVVAMMIVKSTKQEDPRVLAEKQAKEQEEQSRERQTEMGMTTKPVEVVVNIRGKSEEEEHYAKIGIQLEFDNIKHPKLGEGLELRLPKIKNMLIEALTNTMYEDLISPEGKVRLRDNLVREINKTIPRDEGSVRDVFLSEFVVQ